MPASTTHRTKRPYQGQTSITSYFTRGDYTTSGAQSPSYERSNAPLSSPPLPTHIQSSLLNVGMRVRKSVPEGYKTHKTLQVEEELFGRIARIESTSTPTFPPSRPTELMPFCGLHKTGGYGFQSSSGSFHDVGGAPVDALGDSSFPGSSQESMASTISTDSAPAAHPLNAGKRVLDAEEDGDVLGEFDDDAMLREFDSAQGLGPAPDSLDAPALTGRKIRQARVRQRFKAAGGIVINSASMPAGAVDDFDEADFLQPRDVHMGDA